jgi:ribosomal protein S18 acetylase RimI-like enzyme
MNNLPGLEILPIRREEIKILSDLAIQTFKESYYADNEKDLFDQYVEGKLNPDQFLKEWLNDQSYFYFARLHGNICGYLKINFKDAQTETHPHDWMEIERIYILKAFQGKKLGTKLFNFALEQAIKRHNKYIWVGVWKKNSQALKFYKGIGFVDFGVHLFDFGGTLQEDYILRFAIT